MKKFFPLYLATLSCLFFIAIIYRNELHLNNSQSIFIKLQPVDPRSLIQGDYMVLNYELFWDTSSLSQDKNIENQSKIMAYITLDEKQRLIASSLTASSHQPLMLKNPQNTVEQLYPSSNSFFFAEGLASCYDQAQYAEFKIDKRGKSILANLTDAHLKTLNCKQQKNWFQGFQ